MTVYTDSIHMTADSLDELHAFAKKMHFPRCWFQHKKQEHPHYDLTTRSAFLRAVAYGAEVVSSERLIRIIRSSAKGDIK